MNTPIDSGAGRLRRICFLAGAAITGAALALALPVSLDHSGTHVATALAGKGSGKDNGRGGSGGHGHGHNKAGHGAASLDGKKPKLPGSLNAANASPQALDHANRRSRVGALGAYMDAMADYADAVARGDIPAQEAALDAAAAALADAANKNVEINTGVVDAVNRTLDGKAEGFHHTGAPGDPIHEAEPEIADRINQPLPTPYGARRPGN